MIIITKDEESLKLASEIIAKRFGNPPKTNIDIQEWDKWKNWFLKQQHAFNSGNITISTYFTQVKRVQQYFLEKMQITVFEMEKQEREKQYDLTQFHVSKPEKLSTDDIERLVQITYKHLCKEDTRLKANPRVETTFATHREKLFGRELSQDLNSEITKIKNSQIKFDNKNTKFLQLGKLHLQLEELEEAKKAFNKIETPTLKYSALSLTASKEHDFDSFKSYMKQGFPEILEPVISGPYILGFLIGNEWNYRYEIDEQGKRCLSFPFSSGIYQTTQMDIFQDLVRDVRISPDGRLGLWLRPSKSKNSFVTKNTDYLIFKQVIGWTNI
ncbi:MAG: hypothetical protein ACFFAU_14690 [Candidatus Hodarchaeota archaeon]